MPTIAIVGAGRGLGLAIARRFGSEGYDVALISRSTAKLDALVDELAAEGITAAGFAADVLDRPALRAALVAAKEHFGGIDVLEYSPADASAGPLAPVDIRETTPENVQPQIEYYLYGAMAATEAVLPDLLTAGSGTLLFTTGAGSVYPVAQYGNVTAGGAALRNWALNLGGALAGTGVHVAHVAIALYIADDAPAPGVDWLPAADIAALYWDLHDTRAVHELVVRK
ncbi:SDR family NAD(P)-dependent oxidoreductase [uncultured Leifsonia sp.]|uniref:SDR family NAD(P)-dependent oxidoreductase n=1 Tax=uncultured Leifsonia sp. TaxID=340359 RepID=UPI0028D210EB|nr:SDR family NAD(P)-dependent oxidoreductase [uncultured Leifsonia sp.]